MRRLVAGNAGAAYAASGVVRSYYFGSYNSDSYDYDADCTIGRLRRCARTTTMPTAYRFSFPRPIIYSKSKT